MILLAIALSAINIQPPTKQYPEHAPAVSTTKRSAVEAGAATPEYRPLRPGNEDSNQSGWVTQDDGYGACPAFEHSHADEPGKCFDNDDHIVSDDSVERRVLPVPAQ